MKRSSFIILTILIFANSFAQSISISSFKLLETDLTANTAGTIEKDQNGETAALIKVVTTQTGFTFDGGALGIVKTKQTPGEVWVYIPKGSKKISIKHPQLGVLRDYYFPIAIEAARTYEMVLVTGEVKTIIKQDLGAQYLVMTIEPANALVHIDDKEIAPNNGVISKLFDYGKHTYTISAPLYHTEAGVFEISSNKCEMNIKLKPNYGIVAISTTPEEGASVFLDNDIEPIGITPMNTRKLSQGEHSFKVQKNGYLSQVEKYNVIGDGSIQQLSISMKQNFGILKAAIPNGCVLYVDDEAKDVSEWNGRLGEGVHIIEARCPSHRSNPMRIEMKVGQTLSMDLPEPMPITGSLNINSEPINAKIIIDGKEYGKTPMIINNLLVGEHDVELQLGGYNKIKRTITIEEGEMTNNYLNMTREEVPSSIVKTDALNNSIEIKSSNSENTITIKAGTQSINMVFVEEGSFRMGKIVKQNFNDDREKEHKVSLSSFYIGETEVTQELWEYVMGYNPSEFKSKNSPVEKVSWDECQLFIKKLNQLTNLKFRLPTEAEWEYAAQGGNRSMGYVFSGSNNINEVAWFVSTTGRSTCDVKRKKPNELGVYDMSGNVQEWCQDWFEHYSAKSVKNPKGPKEGVLRVFRGGGWNLLSDFCTVVNREYARPDTKRDNLGLRLALDNVK